MDQTPIDRCLRCWQPLTAGGPPPGTCAACGQEHRDELLELEVAPAAPLRSAPVVPARAAMLPPYVTRTGAA